MIPFLWFLMLVSAAFVLPVVGVGMWLESAGPAWLAPTWIVAGFVLGVPPYVWFVFVPLVEWAESRWLGRIR